MPQVRSAKPEDMARIRELWKLCFHDSEQFMDWFFAERFFPSLSSVLTEDDGVIMSALQSCPLHIRIRDKILPASMLAGVSTHPERNGRGYMKQIFFHFMQQVAAHDIPFAIHTPAHLPTFFSRGHYPATDTLHAVLQNAHAPELPQELTRQSLYEDLAPLHACYQQISAKHSGSVSRTMADFAFKFRDYASDGARCLVRRQGQIALGYCVYYVMENDVHAEECYAEDNATLRLLLDGLRYDAAGRKLHMKLPPDTAGLPDEFSTEIRPQGVMGIAIISTALATILGNSAYVFEVLDATQTSNTGIWDGMGQKTQRPPQIRLEAGRLGQFLCGYRSLQELADAKEAEILDAAAAAALDAAYPKQTCFITDEY